jgi:hypothetical protein
VKTFRSIIMFLLLPILIIALFWEAGLALSEAGHAFAQISIVVILCALALRIAHIDEMERLKEINCSYANRYHNQAKTRKVARSSHKEMLATTIRVNDGNGHRNKSDRENIPDKEYPILVDGLDGGSQSVPKTVK